MVDIRITYNNKEEKEKLIKSLSEKYNVISISKPYRNFRNKSMEEYRVYVKVEIWKITEKEWKWRKMDFIEKIKINQNHRAISDCQCCLELIKKIANS